MTEEEDHWVLPPADVPQDPRPDDVRQPPAAPGQEIGGQGSLDLPANDGDLDVGDPPTRDNVSESVAREVSRSAA